MIKVVKINKLNYFLDSNENIVNKYDPQIIESLVLKLDDGSVLKVDQSEIHELYGGQIVFDYGEDRYIIDDGYQNLLIRAGYIVLNNYDTTRIEKSNGIDIRNTFMKYCIEVVDKMWDDKNYKDFTVLSENQSVKISFERNGFVIKANIDTVNGIVAKNQQRKVNNLPFYPFIKNMDKYGTLYLSVFVQKIDDNVIDTDRYEIAEEFCIKLLNLLNEYSDQSVENHSKYHLERIIIKKRINYYESI